MSVVSAQENANDITDSPLNEIEEKNLNIKENIIEENGQKSISLDDDPIITENDKQDINTTIIFPDEISPYKTYYNSYEYLIEIDNLPDDYDTNMTILIDNEFITTTNVRNQAKINPNWYSYAEHTITVELPDTEKYAAKNLTKKFTATPILIEIPTEIVVSENNRLDLYGPFNTQGTLTVNYNGEKYAKRSIYSITEGDDHGYVNLNELVFGKQYEIEAIYTLNDFKYVKKVNSTVSGYDLTWDVIGTAGTPYGYFPHGGWVTYGGKNNIIQVRLPQNANPSNARITIDGVTYTLDPIIPYDGEAHCTLKINELSIGKHEVSLSYEDEYYPLFYRNFTLEIRAIINEPNSEFNYGDEYEAKYNAFRLKLPNDASGNLKLYFSDHYSLPKNESQLYESVSLKDGFACISVAYLPLGDYYYYACYEGDDYNVTEAHGNFKVNLNVHINYPMFTGETQYITFLSHPQDNRLLNITIKSDADWKKYNYNYNLKLVNGTGKLLIPKLPSGGYSIGIFDNNGAEIYESMMIDDSYVRFENGKNINMFYYDGSKYSIKIYENQKLVANKKVTFVIGKNKYVRTTNSNGVATLNLKELPGTYTIKTIYNGKYASGQTSNKIVIKKMLTLSSVKVKKSAKKLVLTAKLSKKLKNQKITFKFNGKACIGYTNNKGIAKVTIKSKILKKLTVGKKVNYQATYIKETVKKTATVKK